MFQRECHLASFLLTQSSLHTQSQAGAGTSQLGGMGFGPKKVRPCPPIFHILSPQVQQHPYIHLKLISDLGPWGTRDLPRGTQSLSSLNLSLPPKIASQAPTPMPPILPQTPPTCLSIVPEWSGRPQLDPWTVAP